MRRRLSLVVVTTLLALSVTLLVKSTYQPPLPSEGSWIAVDGTGPPATLAAMKAEADAVLVATYWGQQRSAPIPIRRNLLPASPFAPKPEAGIPTSIHRFEIRELLKPHPLLRNRRSLKLELIGGVQEQPNRIVRISVLGRRDPAVGHLYVLFARRLRGSWIPAFGGDAAGIYNVSGPTAVSLSEVAITPAPSSRTLIEQLKR